MTLIDLTHTISEGMPVFPGSEGPRLVTACECETDGFRETIITLHSHHGTHMDAPAHVFSDGRSLDSLEVDRFVGSALVLDCSDICADGIVSMDLLDASRGLCDAADFILFNTGWSRCWGEEAYFRNYPLVSHDVAEYLVRARKKGIGLDTISADAIDDTELRTHKILLSGGVVIIENLTNLEKIGRGVFKFAALPLKFENSDGAPVRAVAILE
jgi:kynurenine formamidase